MRKAARPTTWDVVIAGAGPAGLSAALVLGRARRRVLLCDTGTPRSWASKEMHAYLSRDGISPQEFLSMARREVRRYPGVRYLPQEVRSARRARGGFAVLLANGRRVNCRKLLIATGVFDIVPRIPGIDELFGRSVFQCPYCDGWEMRDRRVLAYGRGRRGFEMARAMTAWTHDLVLCTDGPARYSLADRRLLERNGIRWWRNPSHHSKARAAGCAPWCFAAATGWRAMPCSSTRPRVNSRAWPNPWAVSLAATGACCAGSTRPRACRACSWRATSSAMCSSRSWPRPKARAPPSASTAR